MISGRTLIDIFLISYILYLLQEDPATLPQSAGLLLLLGLSDAYHTSAPSTAAACSPRWPLKSGLRCRAR